MSTFESETLIWKSSEKGKNQGISLWVEKNKSQPVIYDPLTALPKKTVPTVPLRFESLYSFM